MARIRTIKPEFFTSPDTAKASTEARLFYIALWCWADDWGVGEANLNALLGFAFPEEDQRERKEIQSLCKEVADAYGTLFYENDGRRYYQIPAWEDHQKTQRRAKRRNPTADDPESTPDKRIYGELGPSGFMRGNSESTQGDDQEGTGEQGNIGTGEQGNRESVSDETRPEEKPAKKQKLPEQQATTIAYEATGKSFNYAAVLSMAKWLIHERGLTVDRASQAVIEVYRMGKPITKQVLGQLIDGYLTQPQQHMTASQRRLQEGYEREQRILNGELSFDDPDNPYLQPRPARQAIEGGSSWTNKQP